MTINEIHFEEEGVVMPQKVVEKSKGRPKKGKKLFQKKKDKNKLQNKKKLRKRKKLI